MPTLHTYRILVPRRLHLAVFCVVCACVSKALSVSGFPARCLQMNIRIIFSVLHFLFVKIILHIYFSRSHFKVCAPNWHVLVFLFSEFEEKKWIAKHFLPASLLVVWKYEYTLLLGLTFYFCFRKHYIT